MENRFESAIRFHIIICNDVTRQVVWADVQFFNMCDLLSDGANGGERLDLSSFPKLESIRRNVEENERIAQYLKQRPETVF